MHLCLPLVWALCFSFNQTSVSSDLLSSDCASLTPSLKGLSLLGLHWSSWAFWHSVVVPVLLKLSLEVGVKGGSQSKETGVRLHKNPRMLMQEALNSQICSVKHGGREGGDSPSVL